MKIQNFDSKLKLYRRLNPNICDKEIGLLLWIDNIYRNLPKDLEFFRKTYIHLDPEAIDNVIEIPNFLRIVKGDYSKVKTIEELNSYINIKFNNITNKKSYKENMKRFKLYAKHINQFIEEILNLGKVPDDIFKLLKESDIVKKTNDFYELSQLYKNTDCRRIKFEILRKVGLIILLSRILKTHLIINSNFVSDQVSKIFEKGFCFKDDKDLDIFYWTDEKNKVKFTTDKDEALKIHPYSQKNRRAHSLKTYPIQKLTRVIKRTNNNNNIFMEMRNKLIKDGKEDYTSFIEKIIRKNLEFPTQIYDVVGIRIIVEHEKDIFKVIEEIETFLGGTSTRKKEKNTLHMFGKRKLNEFSSEDYYVWKAIYDVTLSHPALKHLNDLRSKIKNKKYENEFIKTLNYFDKRPIDFIIEVQIQDLKSYLLGVAKGSLAHHNHLKRNQVLSNTFFKIFPKEIYEKELIDFKNKLLKN